MSGLRVLLFSIAVLFASPAWAGEVTGILQEIAAGQAELGTLERKQGELLSATEADKRLYDTYSENNKQLQQRVDVIVSDFKAATERRVTMINGLVDGWNNECAADTVGELDEGPYARCSGLKVEVEQTVSGMREAIKRDAEEIDRVQITPLASAMTRQATAMNDLAARVQARFEIWSGVKASADRTRANLEVLRTRLAGACALKATIEDVHLCASVGWDGANGSLPPLTQIRPPSSATSN